MSQLHLCFWYFAMGKDTEISYSPNPAVTSGSGTKSLTGQTSEVSIHQDEPTTRSRSNHYLRTLSHQAIRTCSDLLKSPKLRRRWARNSLNALLWIPLACFCLCLNLKLTQLPPQQTWSQPTPLSGPLPNEDTWNLTFTVIHLFSCCIREQALEWESSNCLGPSFNPSISSYNIVI